MGLDVKQIGYPKVTDEKDRDSKYASPMDGLAVYNSRTNVIEVFNATYGLWLSSNVRVMIRNTADIVNNRFVYVNGSYPAGGSDHPTVSYPTSGGNDDETIGAVVQIGEDIDVSRAFIAVAVSGEYFVEYGESIAVGEYVYAKTSGANSDEGYAAGSSGSDSGRAGIAFQNSGATVGEANMVLVNIGIVSESF